MAANGERRFTFVMDQFKLAGDGAYVKVKSYHILTERTTSIDLAYSLALWYEASARPHRYKLHSTSIFDHSLTFRHQTKFDLNQFPFQLTAALHTTRCSIYFRWD